MIDEEAERSPFCSLRQLFTFHISYTANCLHYNANSCPCMKYLHATQLFVFHFLHTVSRVSCNYSGLIYQDISFSQVRYGFLRSGMVNSFHRLGMVFSGQVWFSQFCYGLVSICSQRQLFTFNIPASTFRPGPDLMPKSLIAQICPV